MFLFAANAGIVFVGANDKVTEDTYLWVDGTSFAGPWGPGQPNNLNEQDCVCIESAFGYNFSDVACSTPYKFLCETPSTATTLSPSFTTTGPPSPSTIGSYTCQSGYTYYSAQSTCWRLETNNLLTWEAARTECNHDGGDLLVINTDAFLHYIQEEMTTGISRTFYKRSFDI